MEHPIEPTAEPILTANYTETPGGIAAFDKLLDAGEQIAKSIVLINRQLSTISKQIKQLQPTSPGSVLLDLHDCGTKCMGCPHPRWIKWYSPRHNIELKLLGMRITGDPALALTKTGKFKEIYPDLLLLVATAKRLSKDKSKLITALATCKRIVANLPKAEVAS